MKSLFDAPELRTREADSAILKKVKAKKAPTTKSSGGIASKIETIRQTVDKYLGHLSSEFDIIQTEESLEAYIDRAVENNVISIDTETTGLDPLQDDLVGVCLYTSGEKAVYVPVGHLSYVKGTRAKNQLEINDFVKKQFERLLSIDIIMFNACFDIRFIKNHIGVKLTCTWDCYLASRLMNENEPSKGLKPLYKKYILKGEEDAFRFDELFKGVNFAYIPISTAYLYASNDAKITYELYEYQKKYLYYDPNSSNDDRNGMNGVAWVFFNIEMPCVDAVVEMEDNGIEFDSQYAEELHEKYHKILDEKLTNFIDAYSMYSTEIADYKGKVRFDNPININSVPQLQALLYDIIGLEAKDKKKKPTRSTSEEALKSIKSNAVVKAILEYREFSTIVSTFIDKMPTCVNPKDGRIHCKFNQYGADTGRFSSSDPNMQNIPSHNKDIRQMFKATDGYVLMSADYSAQEPRCMTMMCKDPLMIKAYNDGKDLYAEIASLSFNKTYRECLEFQTDENCEWILDKNGDRIPYPDGKERRTQSKSILLGVLYGRGVPSIAEQLGTTTEKAQIIKDSVMKGFPAIPQFEEDSNIMAEELGYVTTLWGRKRRLPDMQLLDYEFEWIGGAEYSNDPLDFDTEYEEEDVPDKIVRKYLRKLKNAWGPKKLAIIEEAKLEGIKITDNTKKRADATRQVVNSRIQGSAADLTKLAMVNLSRNERLKELGFKMLIPIHDEILAEVPEENAHEAKELFAKIMIESAGDKFTIPLSVDVDVMYSWYGEKVDI